MGLGQNFPPQGANWGQICPRRVSRGRVWCASPRPRPPWRPEINEGPLAHGPLLLMHQWWMYETMHYGLRQQLYVIVYCYELCSIKIMNNKWLLFACEFMLNCGICGVVYTMKRGWGSPQGFNPRAGTGMGQKFPPWGFTGTRMGQILSPRGRVWGSNLRRGIPRWHFDTLAWPNLEKAS